MRVCVFDLFVWVMGLHSYFVGSLLFIETISKTGSFVAQNSTDGSGIAVGVVKRFKLVRVVSIPFPFWFGGQSSQ